MKKATTYREMMLDIQAETVMQNHGRRVMYNAIDGSRSTLMPFCQSGENQTVVTYCVRLHIHIVCCHNEKRRGVLFTEVIPTLHTSH
jgi:hypothetical protein